MKATHDDDDDKKKQQQHKSTKMLCAILQYIPFGTPKSIPSHVRQREHIFL